jgi:hypothetical protein
VGLALAVAAIVVGAASIYLTISRFEVQSTGANAPPPGSLPRPIQILSQAFPAVTYRHGTNSSPYNVSAVFANFTVPLALDRLGALNMSWTMNTSCGTCELFIFKGVVDNTGRFPTDAYAEFSVNGTGYQQFILPGGVEHLYLVQYQYPGYSFTVDLKVIYLGEVPLQ